MIASTSLCRQRERYTLQCQLDLAHAHADINGNDEEESQDKEQEWYPSTAEFMARAIVYWFRAGHMLGGELWDFDLLVSRNELRVVCGGSRGDDGEWRRSADSSGRRVDGKATEAGGFGR